MTKDFLYSEVMLQKMAWRWIPNLISVLRIVLVTLFLLNFIDRPLGAVAIIASDALDGWLARKLDAVSTLGSVLDSLADGFFVLGSWILFYLQGVYGIGVVVVFVIERALRSGQVLMYYSSTKKWHARHFVSDKIIGAVQYLGILWILFDVGMPLLMLWVVLSITVAATAVSVLQRSLQTQ